MSNATKTFGDGTGYDWKSVPVKQGPQANENASPESDTQSPGSLGGEGPTMDKADVGGGNRTSSV